MTVAVILLSLAAVGGTGLLLLRLRGGNPPLGLAMVHGLFAGSGLVALAIAVIGAGHAGLAGVALGLFVVGALFGFYMLSLHLRGRLLPIRVVFTHLTVVAIAFLFLLAAYFGT